ncbi:hypothetical protein FF098_007750 [Parvularcula flava]|uniref:Uncharacterized protein n=1 Tax=Aquisalinus luteolus TaxID=1566827 RepID=A0A8J3A745_9PROT|nr:hypothetical protein [Aquisalinus luteolus]NHK27791.1 hypothetical protein [Aquisalinus luteolus]GGH96513.1 hypothetical protein GCM10011355_15590 [Aquisalinus luteolus]
MKRLLTTLTACCAGLTTLPAGAVTQEIQDAYNTFSACSGTLDASINLGLQIFTDAIRSDNTEISDKADTMLQALYANQDRFSDGYELFELAFPDIDMELADAFYDEQITKFDYLYEVEITERVTQWSEVGGLNPEACAPPFNFLVEKAEEILY